MITWMQKHKKWLIVTIWISTFAFIGAGVVGWGAYSYGDKASAVAKVGDVEISVGEFQQAYSRLYNQIAQLFGGNFDKEKAKFFHLEKQAMKQLINQALAINLAKEYDLSVSDDELRAKIISLPYFQTNGKFDATLYKEILTKNNISIKEYEESLRKELLITKLFRLLPVKATQTEADIIQTQYNIADKIGYKLLSTDNVTVSVDEAGLKKYWEGIKEQFTTQKKFKIAYITQPKVTKTYEEKELQTYYQENKTHFRDENGKLLDFEAAKSKVIDELNQKATKKAALKKYIAFKKGEIQGSKELEISQTLNPFNADLLVRLEKVSLKKPYLKPVAIGDKYIIVKLITIIPSAIKTFEEAKAEVLPQYVQKLKHDKLITLAKEELKNFHPTKTAVVTLQSDIPLDGLDKSATTNFISKLFLKDTKEGYIPVNEKTLVLYKILEQKLLTNNYNNAKADIEKMKQSIFDSNFIKVLRNKYDIEIYKGL